MNFPRRLVALLIVFGFAATPARADDAAARDLSGDFDKQVLPFLKVNCLGCHGREKQEAKLDLSSFTTVDAVARDLQRWDLVLERLEAGEMPPEDAPKQPTDGERKAVVGWIRDLRRREALRNAGDPGPVLARRLSNAEYDYTIRDLTGVDIRPTREFPVDPANEAGFDNSGESLSLSPALLQKYLGAAHSVADHLVLLPDGFTFAPHPAVTDTDRDKFCVQRIAAFYAHHQVNPADYFLAAWRYRHRAALGRAQATLNDVATAANVSPRYLATIWETLTGTDDNAGPLAELREKWTQLPAPGDGEPGLIRVKCDDLRDFVSAAREELIVPIRNFAIKGVNRGSQPIILWKDRVISGNRRLGKLPEEDDSPETQQLRAAIVHFCSVFPDRFVVSERGRMNLEAKDQNKGRLLSAGFHLMVGYYRDDAPLYDLVLSDTERREIDRMWRELDFVTLAPIRQLRDFIYFERAESPRFLNIAEFDFARAEDKDITSPAKMKRLAETYLAKARRDEVEPAAIEQIEHYFADMSRTIRSIERAHKEAEPTHLDALVKFTERAWRRPLTDDERAGVLSFYHLLRKEDGLNHEDAMRDSIVSVLISPYFSFHVTLPPEGEKIAPLTDYELASRLSYFLWSSMPDRELMDHAAAGDLHEPSVLAAQVKRMLADDRVRGLATEFGGNWLDFRRFEQHNSVDRERFPQFTDELRQAMFEEPVRFFVDVAQRNGSILDFLDADYTFVNPVLARHYGLAVPDVNEDEWVRVEHADRAGRGGLLPMAVFLTANSPGLRTSPVKRGYWVVRRLLGERIPAPPPNVPEFPQDEAKLGDLTLRQVLEKHRAVKSCAVCHERFDSFGLVFEGYGPIGEKREIDLGGKPVQTGAEFPDGSEGSGLAGLRQQIRERRQADFVENLCRKLLTFALGRSLLPSDDPLIEKMQTELAGNGYHLNTLIESIVFSRQFLNKRGRDRSTMESQNP